MEASARARNVFIVLSFAVHLPVVYNSYVGLLTVPLGLAFAVAAGATEYSRLSSDPMRAPGAAAPSILLALGLAVASVIVAFAFAMLGAALGLDPSVR